MPSIRAHPTARSERNCRGAGWHRKGYRDRGCMWLNFKRAYCTMAFSRGRDINENQTMQEFIDEVIRDISTEEGFPVPEGCWIDAQRRGKSLWKEPEDALITDYFDGGETVTIKVFDADGAQVLFDPFASQWMYK